MVSLLDRKLLRDLGLLRGQVVTIGLVVACGIASFVTMRSTWASLQYSKTAYYEEYRFADLFVRLKRAPESVRARLQAVPGVARVTTRVVEEIMLPLETLPEPAAGRIVSVPTSGAPPLNGVYLRRGRMVDSGRADEVLVLESFAQAHGLEPGDHLPAVINGTRRDLRVVGLALSPEYVFPMRPGDITVDPERFAVLWMSRDAVAPAFQMEGAFNDVSFRLQPGASLAAVRSGVNRILEPYGGTGAVGRDRQLSNYMLNGEMQQLEAFATAVPIIFLAVAAFLLNVVLSRLVLLQRSQIAALKALGYGDLQIGLHYLKMLSVMVVLGSVLGIAVGAYFGSGMTNLYTQFFRFPVLEYRLDTSVAVTAVGVSLVAAVVGALGAVRRVVRLPPAEAMRPAPPIAYRKTLLERLGLSRLLGPAGRMILREVERRPLRTVLSALGIAMAVAILVVGRFMFDAIDYLMDVYFHRAWREDVSVTFIQPVPQRARHELAHLPGVEYAEGIRVVPVRFRAGHRWRDSVLNGHPPGAELRRVLDRDANEAPMPREGVMLTRKLGEILGVRPGDDVEVQILEGNRGRARLRVASLVEEAFGLQGYMELGALQRFLHEDRILSMVLLRIDPFYAEELHRRLKELPKVASVTRGDAIYENFREQSGEMMFVFSFIMTFFACIIAIGVVYNNARVALSIRARDLASLRVLGFTRAEISGILLGELSIQVLLAIPIGLVVGTWMSGAIMNSQDPEMYRFPIIITERSYAFAALVALGSGLVSALLVRRKLDRLDLIAVLKTRD